jgi:hypothetical protein
VAVVNDLVSDWDGLSPFLLASFYEVDSNGAAIGDYGTTVKAPLTDAKLEMTANWQMPFEKMGDESNASLLFAKVQADTLKPLTAAAVKALSDPKNPLSQLSAADKKQSPLNFSKQFEGRTGLTKLNSLQVFSGMLPLKITVTALFRAWSDARAEVQDPIRQLMAWGLPKKLADDLGEYASADKGKGTALDVLLPSQAPTYIGMRYKNQVFAPLVITTINLPLGAPINKFGDYVEMSVMMTLTSLSAIDSDDWQKKWSPPAQTFLI